jgi:hypothetical protein
LPTAGVNISENTGVGFMGNWESGKPRPLLTLIKTQASWLLVRFEVFTAVSMKMGDFWVVVPITHRPDDGGSKHL